jgi:aryl-alcohol dehydrogenase-like predicted oxidoreductase
MLERSVETELLSHCQASRIGVIGYSPMHKGLLTGQFSKQRLLELAEDDHRRRDLQFQEPRLSPNLALVDALTPIAKRHSITTGVLAIAWVLRRPEVTAAIVGGRKPTQIEQTAGVTDLKLSEGVLTEIENLLKQRQMSISDQ